MLELSAALPLAVSLPQGTGLTVAQVGGLGIATLQPHRGHAEDAIGRIRAVLGLRLEDGPVRTRADGLAALGIGPSKWLVIGEGAGNRLARRLLDVVGDAAAAEDQSDGYAVLRIAGPGCLGVLARGVNIDLHPAQFGVGAVAVTSIAHIGAILWRCEDEAGVPAFEIAVFRSLAGSLLHWLDASITGAGLRLS